MFQKATILKEIIQKLSNTVLLLPEQMNKQTPV